jgi:hypothetical protein
MLCNLHFLIPREPLCALSLVTWTTLSPGRLTATSVANYRHIRVPCRSMLHVNCDMNALGTDILQLRYNGDWRVPLDIKADPNDPVGNEEGRKASLPRRCYKEIYPQRLSPSQTKNGKMMLRYSAQSSERGRISTACSLPHSEPHRYWLHTNPARFPHREAIRSFF